MTKYGCWIFVTKFWSVFVPGVRVEPSTGSFIGDTLQQVDCVHQLVARHPDRLELVTTADGLEELARRSDGPIASLLGVEPGSEKARMFEGGSLAIFRCAPLSCLSL